MTFDEFETAAYEIADTFPEDFYRELNGGIIVKERALLHPADLHGDLFVLGEYHRDHYLGRFIVVYYGSFLRCYGPFTSPAPQCVREGSMPGQQNTHMETEKPREQRAGRTGMSDEAVRGKLRKVLLHEFRHHLESLAGERDLEIEDAINISRYAQRARQANL
ncbi:MAG: metallopeptidase family protein [Lachnospiraceae bacterium]|nr:metallopeptidase family protein [Lachnospiraceae bacterium]MCD7765987.1 metallopeptidase family protein [Lachnospiraceae bacterium]